MLSVEEITQWRDQLARLRVGCAAKCDATIESHNCMGYCGDALILTMILMGKTLYNPHLEPKPPEDE